MNIMNQPNFNIGTLGSVSDGKSTLIYQLTGIKTQRHSSEQHRNITIKPGYANLKIWECLECNTNYSSGTQLMEYLCSNCDSECKLIHHISFVDCPGHQELILTMMGSVSLMKGAIVVISAAEPILKKPQLIQHLIAAKKANIDKIIICFNKLDLITKELALERKEELDKLLNTLGITASIIIPTALNQKLGIDNVLQSILDIFPPEVNEITNEPLFRITRSFDINKPSTSWLDVKGGVIGGSLIKGSLNIGDQIEIRPGILTRGKDGRYTHTPIITNILSIESDNVNLDSITPGGLVAILTDIDPYYTKGDMLSGNILGKVGELPTVYHDISLEYSKLEEFDGIWNPKNGDAVYLQIGNITSEARLTKIKGSILSFQLIKPSCIEKDSKILVCRKELSILKIVGMGFLFKNIT
uniref:protein-synthesizing GTPase n=1 Tax=viral metagenome TaxID=1070528 RepID=A0A6C0D9N9_9ZZZZ